MLEFTVGFVLGMAMMYLLISKLVNRKNKKGKIGRIIDIVREKRGSNET